jgi:O-antigen/teichoic acid export membrane protein
LLWTAAGLAFIVIWAIGAHYDRDTVWVVVLVALAKAFDSLSDIVRGVFQRCERMDYSAVSLMIKGVGAAVAVGLVISARSVIAASAAMAVVYLISFFAYDLLWARSLLGGLADQTPEHRRMRPRFRWASIVRLSWTALPLGIVMGLITLQINIPRYVLEGYFGLAALGFFTAMVYPIQAGQMVIGALGQSAAPRLARYFAEDLAAYRVLLRKLLLVAGGLAALMVLTTALGGRPILRIFFDPAYAEYHLEFVVLAIAAAVQLISSCWGYALTSARRFRVQVTVTTISCLVTALAALLLVPRYGVLGASISVLVTSIVLWIVLLVVMRSTLRRRGTMDTSLATPGGDNEVEGS